MFNPDIHFSNLPTARAPDHLADSDICLISCTVVCFARDGCRNHYWVLTVYNLESSTVDGSCWFQLEDGKFLQVGAVSLEPLPGADCLSVQGES